MKDISCNFKDEKEKLNFWTTAKGRDENVDSGKFWLNGFEGIFPMGCLTFYKRIF